MNSFNPAAESRPNPVLRLDFFIYEPITRNPGRLMPDVRRSGAQRADSSRRLHKMSTSHPQIRQREQGRDLSRVLDKSAVAHLDKSELPLDDPKWVLDLGSDACLHFLDPHGRDVMPKEWIELPALARAHRNMPSRACGLGALVHALVAGVAEGDFFLAVQQLPGRVEVVDLGWRRRHRVDQSGGDVHADVRFHSKCGVCPYVAPGGTALWKLVAEHNINFTAA